MPGYFDFRGVNTMSRLHLHPPSWDRHGPDMTRPGTVKRVWHVVPPHIQRLSAHKVAFRCDVDDTDRRPLPTAEDDDRSEGATWLILPVVICLSQRLSHACESSGRYNETANGSLNQL